MKMTVELEGRIPAPVAAMQRKMSRERLIRLIQSGEIPGGRDDAGWYVLAREATAD